MADAMKPIDEYEASGTAKAAYSFDELLNVRCVSVPH
jgi:hypothetical protein